VPDEGQNLLQHDDGTDATCARVCRMKLIGPATTRSSTAPPTRFAEICQACHHCPLPIWTACRETEKRMTETLIDIEDELLDEAATVLGTSSIKDTVNAALADVLRVRAAASSRGRPATEGTTTC
jgi:Arc/MetJ family transcription regulator